MGEQAATVAFLARPATYGLADGETVERIETHISTLFLAGGFAYKLKKSVFLSYLDFSTCERRKIACAEELRLNRRTAPEIYDRVAPIRRTGTELHLGGDRGEVIDWVVVMHRFDNGGLLARLADRGELDPALVEQTAVEAAHLHERAERYTDAGGAAVLRAIADSNQRSFEPALRALLSASSVGALTRATHSAIAQHAALLDRRRDAGFVRRCHGDLHLGNIVRIKDRPVLFDCIEFNDAFSMIDVLYDLAFLLMDLAFRAAVDDRLHDYANRALNAYLDQVSMVETGGMLEGLASMPLFVSMRAAIRSHVHACNAAEGGRARAYLDFALGALTENPPMLIAIGGLSGTGKSTLAKGIAPFIGGALGAVHLRSDVIRKKLWRVPLLEPLPQSAYTQRASDLVYAEMFRLAAVALRAGFPVVLDAVFSKAWEREAAEHAAALAGVPFRGIWLEAGQHVLEERVSARARTGTDASDADVGVVRHQLASDPGWIGWHRVDSNGGVTELRDRVRGMLPI